MSPVLQVQGLSVTFRPQRGAWLYAVNGVDLTLERGELLGLVGETGSGKSVTARAALGLIRPPGYVTGGRVLLGDIDLMSLDRERRREIRGRRIAYIPQNPRGALNPLLRIGRQMRNLIKSHDGTLSSRAIEARCRERIEAVGIPDPDRILAGHPHQLSGGMAQRVVIAMALLLDPELVIADEPTTGLDVTIQAQILELLSRSAKERDCAVVLITHDLGVVAHYCQTVAVMYAGRVVERGTVAEIFRDPEHPYTVGLLRSVPVIGQPLYRMPGQTPQLHSPPVGCTFAARCPHATAECRATDPPWKEFGATHRAFCHWPEQLRVGEALVRR